MARHIREDRSSTTSQKISKTPVGSDAPTGGDPQVTPSPPPSYTVCMLTSYLIGARMMGLCVP